MMRGLLQGLGLACLALSGAWWFAFFQKVGLATGVKVEGLAQDVWPCLFYTTAPCQVAYSVAELAGYLSYRPFLTWIGFGLFVLGCFVSSQKAAPRYQPPPRERQAPRF